MESLNMTKEHHCTFEQHAAINSDRYVHCIAVRHHNQFAVRGSVSTNCPSWANEGVSGGH